MNEVDFLIVGAGPSGLSAALYASRAGLSVKVLDADSSGGQTGQIDVLENYPGLYPPVSGSEFIGNLRKQASSFGAEILKGKALSIEIGGAPGSGRFRVLYESLETSESTEIFAKAVLYAVGAVPRKLEVPGENECFGRGVSYCAVCDGPFFRNRNVIVVGGGDSALSEAVYLSSICKHVELVHRRSTFRAQKAVSVKILKAENVSVRLNTVVQEIKSNKAGNVSSAVLKNVLTEREEDFPTDAVFIFAGREPDVSLIENIEGLRLDPSGYVVTDECMRTTVSGLFCAGDVRKTPFRQVVTACSDGAVAAFYAEKYISDLKMKGNGVFR